MVEYIRAYNFITKNYTKEEIRNIFKKIEQKVEGIKARCDNRYDTIQIVEAILNVKKMHNIIKMFFVLYLAQILNIDFEEDFDDVAL